MKSEFENRLETLFRDADVALPGSDFQLRVISQIRKKQRRDALERAFGTAAALALASILIPQLDFALPVIAASLLLPLDLTIRLLAELSASPLTYIYASALVGYLVVRFPLRIMRV